MRSKLKTFSVDVLKILECAFLRGISGAILQEHIKRINEREWKEHLLRCLYQLVSALIIEGQPEPRVSLNQGQPEASWHQTIQTLTGFNVGRWFASWAAEATLSCDLFQCDSDCLCALDEAIRREIIWEDFVPTSLADLHEDLLDFRSDGHQKGSGTYYTPPALVQMLLKGADPAFSALKTDGDRFNFFCCDPSCGSGNVLIAVARFLVSHRSSDSNKKKDLVYDIITSCIYGVDLDSLAVELCRIILWMELVCYHPVDSEKKNKALEALNRNILCGDSLCGPVASRDIVRMLFEDENDPSIVWPLSFPEVFKDGGFHLVIGNPPFIKSVRSGKDKALGKRLSGLYPDIKGSANLASYFLSKSTAICRQDGVVSLVLPQSLLGALSCKKLRRTMTIQNERNDRANRSILNMVYLPRKNDLFLGASVDVVVLSTGPEDSCSVGVPSEEGGVSWSRGVIRNDNWWFAISLIMEGKTEQDINGHRLGDLFHVIGSMTVHDYYAVKDHILDLDIDIDNSLKLVTTGLIDPDVCLWGDQHCRYLKQKFMHPRIPDRRAWSNSFSRRLLQARRPKIIVAGLSAEVECFVDTDGAHLGAVSTYSIFHEHDDLQMLEQLKDFLHSKEVGERFRFMLGGNALGASLTMSKEFLKELVIPSHRLVT